MFLNGYIYVDVINGARQCAEENKMQKPRMWSEKQSCSKQMAESPAEQRENRAGKTGNFEEEIRTKEVFNGSFFIKTKTLTASCYTSKIIWKCSGKNK